MAPNSVCACAIEEADTALKALATGQFNHRQGALQSRRKAEDMLPSIIDPNDRAILLCKLAEISFGLNYRSDAHDFISRAQRQCPITPETEEILTRAYKRFIGGSV